MYLFSRFKLWFFNVEEKKIYLSKQSIKRSNHKNLSIIQCPHDLLFFYKFKEIIVNENNTRFEGISPNLSYVPFVYWIFIIPKFIKKFHHLMIRRKWKKIYSKLGIKTFFHPMELSINKKIKNFILAINYFRRIKNKKQLLEHKFKKIKCGDLIYDSYMRFNKKPTVNIKNPSLFLFIYDCYNQIEYYESLTKKYRIKKYFSSYSTYISHGIPVRVFLERGIRVFTTGYSTPNKLKIKELTRNDTSQVSPHWNFKKVFKSLKNKDELIKKGLSKLKKRVQGHNDLTYMRINQYSSSYNSPELQSKFDGVVFIGDFFDSQHIYRSIIFNDLYEWLLYTIKFTLDNNLNIGFKIHPNHLEGSRKILNKIKSKYPQINWIDSRVSNKIIFKSGIKFGISVYGSILPELAFHKIKPICCGDNPASGYNFIFEAKSIENYNDLILNYKSLKFKKNFKNQLGEFFYMNNIFFSNMR